MILCFLAVTNQTISRLGISWRALNRFCSQHKGQLLGLTTTEVRDRIIKPATVHLKCSYADLYPDIFGPANAFVSHAWRYRFLKDLVAAIKAWRKQQPRNSIADLFLWIDIFVVNQHIDPPKILNTEEEERNFKTFSDGFQEALKGIGRAIIVLSPWNRPEWMFRIWCLFEFCIMEMFQIQYEFVMPPEQERSFIHSLEEEGNTFLNMVSTLNMEHAEAQSDYDKVQIKKLVVDKLGGFSKLNESAVGAVRRFCIQTCMSALSTMTEEKKASSKLLENSALLLWMLAT